MKLTRFIACEVFGYLNFDVKFNDDITFLTGINGSGKTSALRLMVALTTPSLRELDQITHEYAEIYITTKDYDFSIRSNCTDESIIISVSAVEERLVFPRIDLRQYDDRPDALERINEHYSIVEEKLTEHDVIKFLSEIDTPTFLGLERRQQLDDTNGRMIYENNIRRPISRRRRPPFKGTLGASLSEIQSLIQDFFRRIRMRQNRLDEELKEEILLSAFQYEPFGRQHNISALEIPKWQQQREIKEKYKEIESALHGLGISEDKYKIVIADFFDKLSHLAETTKDKESPEFLEWVINKPQIDRIDNIFRIIDEYNKKVSNLLSPIERFLSLINRFLLDSKKELDIDSVGYLVVKIKGQSAKSLEALSSGERQILVMLAHLAINEETRNAGVFIVDEPELSLHLKWQEIFVDSILEASPSTQFVLATHAPSIVLDRDDLFVPLGD